MRSIFLCLLAASSLGGCLYANVRAPRAYRSATPADVKSDPSDPLVAGESCSRVVLYLVAWGDAGYAAATKAALASAPEGVLYDVRVDQKVNSYVLGLYAKTCTIVSARVAKR
ncbi:MAG: hypothetical protein HY925_02060 [Elusimicrobia bacterium]|nr:hypothetical protein [Elusimicrobiota bacterium]